MTELHPMTQKTDNRTDSRNGATWKKQLQPVEAPWGRRGRIRPQHPLACRKRRLNGAACLPWAATRVA